MISGLKVYGRYMVLEISIATGIQSGTDILESFETENRGPRNVIRLIISEGQGIQDIAKCFPTCRRTGAVAPDVGQSIFGNARASGILTLQRNSTILRPL
jgi:hypothetical protein